MLKQLYRAADSSTLLQLLCWWPVGLALSLLM